MGLTTKPSPATAKPKKAIKSNIITLRLSPKFLAKLPSTTPTKKVPESKAPSSTTSNTLVATTSSPGENVFESKSNTPAPSVVDGSMSMPPPTEGVKKIVKNGVKRPLSTVDGMLKPRGKPGPKKKTKLEDGTADILNGTAKGPSYTAPTTGTHKLGPKANQGAINAGLRALDRSGKPCRKWQKSSFKIRSFTGTEWAIPRWAAPPKVTIKGEPDESSSASSSKENKESTHVDSEKSNSAMDIEMGSTASMPPSSPAPIVVASA